VRKKQKRLLTGSAAWGRPCLGPPAWQDSHINSRIRISTPVDIQKMGGIKEALQPAAARL